MDIFCSTIIPTIGRASLSQAVESVLNQELKGEQVEVIVVNDSGTPLPPAAWQLLPHVTVIQTNRRERSLARNAGAAAACGRYLHFLDDDDWIEPLALQTLIDLAQRSGAPWVYGSTQTHDRNGQPLIELHHGLQGNCFLPVMAGEWIPLQASLISAEAFFAVGGFNPLLCGPEDIDLLRRVALRCEIAGTDSIVANILLGQTGSTTDRDRHPIQSRWAREQILDESGVFARLKDSLTHQVAGEQAAWHGRIVRIYLTSALWNLQRRRLWPALSRGGHGLASMAHAGRFLFTGAFVRAVGRRYASHTFARGMSAINEGNAAP
jgi:glycosyltransferase involved in cell wall biosynthesis